MTITEAAACGTPAVATRIAGHADAVVDGRTGLLVDDGPELADARSTRVLADDALRARLGAGALEHAAAFTWDATARGTLEVLAAEALGAAARRDAHARRAPAVDAPTPRRAGRVDSARRALGYALLALLAYVPLLLTAPGKVAADTKQYLYLDPGRLLERAPSMWDPNIGLGTVTHQNIGYLFPMGPYYWLLDQLGVPDWVAQRLWLGTLLFVAGARRALPAAHARRPRARASSVAALAYMLTPYSLDYAARISVLLLPWAALPWMIGLIAQGAARRRLALSRALRARRAGRRRRERDRARLRRARAACCGSPYAVLRRARGRLAPRARRDRADRRAHARHVAVVDRRALDAGRLRPRHPASTPRRSRPSRARRSPTRCSAGSATGSSTAATSSARGSRRASTTRSTSALILAGYGLAALALLAAAFVRWRHRVVLRRPAARRRGHRGRRVPLRRARRRSARCSRRSPTARPPASRCAAPAAPSRSSCSALGGAARRRASNAACATWLARRAATCRGSAVVGARGRRCSSS